LTEPPPEGGATDFRQSQIVLSLNPTFAQIDTVETDGRLNAARAGDVEAFGELCRVYETRLLRHAMTLGGDESAAADLAEDTLVEAWTSLHRYDGGCRFFTWLCAILLNRHRNLVRRKRPLPAAALGGGERAQFQDAIANAPDHRPWPDQAVQLREQAAVVWQCLQALPHKQRQVVYLRFYADESLEGVASALGCSVGTVKSRLFHALDKLRHMDALISRVGKDHNPEGTL
jgi:RNA polymerase sigma-70 factor (ECF subfamily)